MREESCSSKLAGVLVQVRMPSDVLSIITGFSKIVPEIMIMLPLPSTEASLLLDKLSAMYLEIFEAPLDRPSAEKERPLPLQIEARASMHVAKGTWTGRRANGTDGKDVSSPQLVSFLVPLLLGNELAVRTKAMLQCSA